MTFHQNKMFDALITPIIMYFVASRCFIHYHFTSRNKAYYCLLLLSNHRGNMAYNLGMMRIKINDYLNFSNLIFYLISIRFAGAGSIPGNSFGSLSRRKELLLKRAWNKQTIKLNLRTCLRHENHFKNQ